MPKKQSARPRHRPNIKKQPASRRRRRFFLPWPFIAFSLLVVGVMLIGWTFQTTADDVHVTAKVSAPLPAGPAIITSPGDGSRFTQVPITLSGTCPTDTYVKIYRNDLFSGTAMCTTDGNFTLDVDLFAGQNKLEAKIFNITDDEGPASTPVTVFYDVPQQPTSSSNTEEGAPTPQQPSSQSPTSAPTPTVPPLTLKTDFGYKGYKVGQSVEWTFNISGGAPPYAVNVDWGDGTNSVISQKDAGQISASHRYKKVGDGANGSYKVKASASDAQGRQTFLQMFLIIVPSGVPGFVSNTLPAGPHISASWLKLIWPAYFVVILMSASFWLGEREEVVQLHHRGKWRGRRI